LPDAPFIIKISTSPKSATESNWAPRVLCQPINKFRPCVDDYGCRSILDAVRAGRTPDIELVLLWSLLF
jgi:hypothetical protein